MSKVILDMETGAIDRELRPGDRIYSQEQIEAFKELEARKKTRGRSFGFASMTNIEDLRKEIVMGECELTVKDLGYFLMLQTFIDFNGILFESTQATKPMNRTSIGKSVRDKKGSKCKTSC